MVPVDSVWFDSKTHLLFCLVISTIDAQSMGGSDEEDTEEEASAMRDLRSQQRAEIAMELRAQYLDGAVTEGCGKEWAEMNDTEQASAGVLGWDEDSWQAGDVSPYERPLVEMGETALSAAFFLGMDLRLFSTGRV